jgi:hypothetical protein
VPGGGGVKAQHAGERAQPLGFKMPALSVLTGVEAHQVVEAVATRPGGLQELGVDQPLQQPGGAVLGLVEQPGGGCHGEVWPIGEAEQAEGSHCRPIDGVRAVLQVLQGDLEAGLHSSPASRSSRRAVASASRSASTPTSQPGRAARRAPAMRMAKGR